MKFKFIVTMDGNKTLVVEADIDKLTLSFEGEKHGVADMPDVSNYTCDICKRHDGQGKATGICKAVNNIFELCKYFMDTQSIDKIDMTVIQNDKCIHHSLRKADDALMEMMLVIIAASGCANFGRVRWGWNYWNYECKLDNLFYNLFSSFLVLECLTGDSKEPLNQAIEHVHTKIDKMQQFVYAIINHVRTVFSNKNADATSNALAAIWTIGDLFKLRMWDMLDQLRKRIEATQPKQNQCLQADTGNSI